MLMFILCLCIQCAVSANILIVSVIPAYSHQMIIHPIVRELCLREHQVTFITPNPLNDPTLQNLTEFDISFVRSIMDTMGKSYFEKAKLSPYFLVLFRRVGLTYFVQAVLQHPPIKSLIENKTTNFDVVIIEPMHPLVYAYGGRFNCPMVGLLSHFPDVDEAYAVGSALNPITNPHFTLGYTNRLSLPQRLNSVLLTLVARFQYKYLLLPFSNFLAKQYFGNDLPYLEDLEKNLSVTLTATHPLFTENPATRPTLIQLGVVERFRNNKTLSKDLKDFLDSATDGVIYFSLGSLMKTKIILSHKLKIITEVFSELTQHVLWIWENDYIENLSQNVKLCKWVPQELVLKHSNTKVFITAGGTNSIMEATLAQIAVLVIPLQYEQFYISKKVVEYGIGRAIDVDDFDKTSFKDALLDLLTNPRYAHEISTLNGLFDQPMKGVEKAVWWIEYVIRNKGAKHLRNVGEDLPFYQYYMYDVVAVFILSSVLAAYLAYKIINRATYKCKKD